MLSVKSLSLLLLLCLSNAYAKEIRSDQRFVLGTNTGTVLKKENSGLLSVNYDGYGGSVYLVHPNNMFGTVDEWRGFQVHDQVKKGQQVGIIREIFANGSVMIFLSGYNQAYLFPFPLDLELTKNQPEFDLIKLDNLAKESRSKLSYEEALRITNDIISKYPNMRDMVLRYGIFNEFTPRMRAEDVYDPVMERRINRRYSVGLDENYKHVEMTLNADSFRAIMIQNLVGKKLSQISVSIRVPHRKLTSCRNDLELVK